MVKSYKKTVASCYLGYIVEAVVVNLLPVMFIVLQNRYGISFEELGRLIFVNFVTQFSVDLLSIKLVDKIGYRVSFIGAHLFTIVGLLLLGILPQLLPPSQIYGGLLVSVFFYAVGGGMLEVLVSPMLNSIPGEAKPSSMSLLHSFYSWGQVLTIIASTLMLHFFGYERWFLLPLIWLAIPIINVILFSAAPLPPPMPEDEKIPLGGLMKKKFFLAVMLLMLCAGAAEMSMSQWASLFAEEALGIPKIAGDIAGPCLFAVFMGLGRTFFGFYSGKINMKLLLSLSGTICLLCYIAAALVPHPIVSMAACALTGLGVSMMWPGLFSFTADRYPHGGTAMFGTMSLCGDIGCSVGPWVAGMIADSTPMGLRGGLLAAAVFPVIMAFGVTMLKSGKAHEGETNAPQEDADREKSGF